MAGRPAQLRSFAGPHQPPDPGRTRTPPAGQSRPAVRTAVIAIAGTGEPRDPRHPDGWRTWMRAALAVRPDPVLRALESDSGGADRLGLPVGLRPRRRADRTGVLRPRLLVRVVAAGADTITALDDVSPRSLADRGLAASTDWRRHRQHRATRGYRIPLVATRNDLFRTIKPGAAVAEVRRLIGPPLRDVPSPAGAPTDACWVYSRSPSQHAFRARGLCFSNGQGSGAAQLLVRRSEQGMVSRAPEGSRGRIVFHRPLQPSEPGV